ncbi:MAG TPA: flagellar biosynthesis anti-sigma factor FlgM [Chloroflexota bacterium]|nr:flagellar biosynthesis anti-sigma factor FlgM [Chloroflexota bacterium]
MDISSNGMGPIRDFIKTNSMDQSYRSMQKGRSQTTPSLDSVTISDRGLDLARIKDAVLSAPDVREEKVAATQEAVAQGSYNMSPVEIAKAILASRMR